MNKTTLSRSLAASLAALFMFTAGCGSKSTPSTPTASPSAPAAPAAAAPAAEATPSDMAPDTVLATVGSEKITAGELDSALAPQFKQMEEQVKKQKFELRKQHLDQMINEKLVKAEAAKRGVTEEQLFKAEIDDKVPAPSEADIKKLYDQSAARLPPGSTIEQFRGQITEYLSRGQKQQKAQEFFAKLRKDAKVKVALSEPRVQVEAKGPSRGPNDAKVTVVEFSDFECPYCGRAHDTVEDVMKAYDGKVKLVFRQYPLPMHPHAAKAAEAALCANEQGKFWQLHDAMFKNQRALEPDQIKGYAKDVGLDSSKFNQCFDSGKYTAQVKADQDAGSAVGVSGTPAFFINGRMLSGAQPISEFKRVIDEELGS